MLCSGSSSIFTTWRSMLAPPYQQNSSVLGIPDVAQSPKLSQCSTHSPQLLNIASKHLHSWIHNSSTYSGGFAQDWSICWGPGLLGEQWGGRWFFTLGVHISSQIFHLYIQTETPFCFRVTLEYCPVYLFLCLLRVVSTSLLSFLTSTPLLGLWTLH